MLKALFVNSGILGMASFARVIREALANHPDLEAVHINLAEHLSLDERVIRRIMCARLWYDGLLGLNNLDLERFRSECHAGLQARRRMRRLLEAGDVDAIHFHRQPTAYASLSVMKRVPAVVSIDSTQDIVIDAAASRIERASYWPSAYVDGKVFRAARAVVSTSHWAASCLQRRYPDCRTPMHILPTPVKTTSFARDWVEERAARSAAPRYRPRVLFVGHDFVRKGGLDLTAAWGEARLYETADLDLVTNDPIARSGLPGVRVLRSVTPYSSEWHDLWRTADVFVFPTRQDAFGTVLQEAAAASLPRIGSCLGAVPESLHDQDDGLLVHVGNRAELVAALRRLIASRDLRRQFGTAGRRYAEQWSTDRYVVRLHTIIESAVRASTR